MPEIPEPQLPAGGTILNPQQVDVGFGHIEQTGQDVLFVTVHDADREPHIIAVTPPVGFDVAAMLNAKAAKLTALRATTRAIENGEPDDE